ncbi:hypothetical protein M3C30_006175 [Micrococcus luteus]|nr:hypothetical protein [Micrococcus luteus]
MDPIALLVSRVKTYRYANGSLESAFDRMNKFVKNNMPGPAYYAAMKTADIGWEDVVSAARSEGWEIPDIPNICHWFRSYVIRDLGMIRSELANIADKPVYEAMLLALLSCIRSVSNADPVPVSGLEVTAHMRAREANGRLIDTPRAFLKSALRVVESCRDFSARQLSPAGVISCDATSLGDAFSQDEFDVMITSPPYANAVDYYRRHSLEMYWGGFVSSPHEKKKLIPKYIGKHRVAKSHPHLKFFERLPEAVVPLHDEMVNEDPARARDLRAYVGAMEKFLKSAATVLKPGAECILVVGDSTWKGRSVPTSRILAELADPYFSLTKVYSYPIKNRTMSYQRRNGESISVEYVLQLGNLKR